MSFRGGPFFIPVQSSAPEKDRIKLNHDGTHYPIPSVIGARVSFPAPTPPRPPLTAVVRAQQRHLEAAPPRLGGVHLHRQLWGLQLQSLAQGSSVAPVDASARAADTGNADGACGPSGPGLRFPSAPFPRLPGPSPVLNDHRRALRQFLALVHSLCRRGLPLSSDRSHGGDLRRQMQCGAGALVG